MKSNPGTGTEGGTHWYQYDMTNQTGVVKCIKNLEFIVRKSMSYNKWQKETKYPVKSCPVCGDSFEFVKPETHHYPETLFDVVESILNKKIDNSTLYDSTDFEVSNEIMINHFLKKVNYVVLCKHCHEKYHDDVPDVLESIAKAYLTQKEIIKAYNERQID